MQNNVSISDFITSQWAFKSTLHKEIKLIILNFPKLQSMF